MAIATIKASRTTTRLAGPKHGEGEGPADVLRKTVPWENCPLVLRLNLTSPPLTLLTSLSPTLTRSTTTFSMLTMSMPKRRNTTIIRVSILNPLRPAFALLRSISS
ncbi:hypothetical protein KCU93_g461, partial [Aureobasidium melanogenum]